MADAQQIADDRGHYQTGHFSSGEHDLHLAFAPNADIDGEFKATCLDTGDHLTVQGWLYTVELERADDGQPDEAQEWRDFDRDC